MADIPIHNRPSRDHGARRWSTVGGLAVVAGVVLLAGLLRPALPAYAAVAPVGLGTAGAYSVLGGQTVTNTGPSTLAGNLGVSPGTAITGFPPGTVGGATHAGDAQAAQAQSDLVIAYNDAAGRAPTAAIAGDLVGRTLIGGVYASSGPIGLSGTLTLDGQGDPDTVFVFQVASTLITATASSVSMVNGAQPCHVYWQVGSSATLGTTSIFVGTIMALTSITVTTGTVVHGRALARNGQVSLDTNTFTTPDCDTQPTSTTSSSSTTTSPTDTTTTTPTGTTSPSGTSATSTTGPTDSTTSAPGTNTTTSSAGLPVPSSSGNGGPAPTGPRPRSGLADTGSGSELSPLLSLGALLLVVGGLLAAVGHTRTTRRPR